MRYLLLDENKLMTRNLAEVRYILVESRGEERRSFYVKLHKTLQVLQVNKSFELPSEYYDPGIYVGEIHKGSSYVSFMWLDGTLVKVLKIHTLVRLYLSSGNFYYRFIQEEDE